MKKFSFVFSILVVLGLFLMACNLSSLIGTPAAMDENSINTAVAQTLAANNQAGSSPTRTPDSGLQPANTAEGQPTITPQPLATIQLLPSATPTADNCNHANFVTDGDITIPDGSVLIPNKSFTKTWRVKNTGTCTWNTNYAVVFSGGDQMSAPAVTYLPANVLPGSTVDLSVPMVSPATDGDYAGNYMLRSDGGVLFGTGASGMAPIYVDIQVVKLQVIPNLDLGGFLHVFPLELTAYDFAANYCVGNWRNATAPGYLACPGTTADASGFVVQVDSPKLQDGDVVDGVGLLTHPQWIDGGSISGTFPLITVEDGMKFRATLGCGFGGAACDVHFLLRYRIEGGTLTELTHWDMTYADEPMVVDQDLSSLAGKKVNFVLQVVTNGSSAQDWAYWVNPRIIK